MLVNHIVLTLDKTHDADKPRYCSDAFKNEISLLFN